MHFDIVIAE